MVVYTVLENMATAELHLLARHASVAYCSTDVHGDGPGDVGSLQRRLRRLHTHPLSCARGGNRKFHYKSSRGFLDVRFGCGVRPHSNSHFIQEVDRSNRRLPWRNGLVLVLVHLRCRALRRCRCRCREPPVLRLRL